MGRRSLRMVVIGTMAALVGSVALGTGPASAAPSAPGLTQPLADAAVTANPVLSWAPTAGAAKYEVQVSNSADFASGTVKFTQTTLNSSATPPNDLPVGSYWWRVRAFDSANAASAYSMRAFTKETADAPLPRTPVPGDELDYPSEALVLSWDAMPGAKSYELQIDDDEAFVGASAPVSTSNTSYTPTNPPFGTTYYWRVRAKSSQGVPTQYSSPSSYSMVWREPSDPDNGARPVLLSPANTTTTSVEEIVLDWTPLRGASSYDLQISPDQFFNAPIGGTRVVNATAFSPSPTLPAGAYYWRVRGRSTASVPEPSPWSESWVFTRAWPAGTSSSRPRGTEDNRHAQVSLLSPTDNDYSTVTEPVLEWDPQREASTYQVDIGPNVNFSPGTYQTCITNHTVFTPYTGTSPRCLPGTVVPGQVLYWRVRGIDDPASPAVFGLYSETRSFLYDPEFVKQISPADGASVPVPVLRWEPVDNISQYRVTISPVTPVSGCSTVSAVTYNTTFVPLNLSPKCTGEMAWTVQNVEDDGQGGRIPNISGARRFTVTPPATADSIGTITATPLDGTRPPLLEWSSMTGASTYVVYYSVSGANSFVKGTTGTNQPAFSYTGKDGTGWPSVLAPGSYDYYVEAYSASNVLLDRSAVGAFTIGAWPRATRVSPEVCLPNSDVPCALHDTPTLDWEPLPNVALYHVYLATDPNFTNILRDWTTQFSELTPIESLPDSQAGEAYYWYVRPCYTAMSCGPFDPSVFPEAGAFRKESVPVGALSPTASSAPIADEVTFTWTDYLVANYAFNGTMPGGSTAPEVVTQEAESYQVQVSTTAEFTNIIETSPMIDQTAYTAQTKTYPDGPLFWRVRAFDASGNPLTQSCAPIATRTQPACKDFQFEKKSPGPTQSLPEVAASVDDAPAMSWEPMPFAKTYEVEVYSNPTSALSPTNRVVSLTTRSTAAIATTPLAKGSYGWRVRRLDINSLPGRWTAETNELLSTFTVEGPVPSLTLPAAGATVQPTSVLMQWSPVAGASRYKVEVSRDGFATVLESITTDITSWAPGMVSPNWPAGPYSWRVTTLDSAGKPLATTPTPDRSFTLAGPMTATQKGRRLFSPLDFTGDGKTDVMQIATSGDLLLYRGNGSGELAATAQRIGPGWGAFTTVFSPGDFTGDRKTDVMAVNSAGHLILYRGNGAGGWAAAGKSLGAGWGAFKQVFSPGDFTGDGKSDVLAINKVGDLVLYRGNGTGGWAAAGKKIASGWGVYKTVLSPRDFTGDAKSDIMGIDSTGSLYLHKGSGTGGLSGSRVRLGGGWGALASVFSPADFTSDAKTDVLGINSAGDLLLYRGNGRGGWAAQAQKVGLGF